MKPWFLAVIVVVGLAALIGVGLLISHLVPAPSATQLAEQAQQSAQALDNFHASAPECNSMVDPCHGLDINQYFTILPRLSIREGYALDYYMHQDGMGSYPMIYVRKVGDMSFTDEAAYEAAKTAGTLVEGDYTDFIEVEDTPQGYLDLAVFHILSGQFYLGWHANYFDSTIVSTPEKLESVLASRPFGLEIPQDVADAARKLDLNPVVTMGEKDATVSMVMFTNWGGFYRLTLKFDRSSPHKLLDSSSENLVKYECGVMF